MERLLYGLKHKFDRHETCDKEARVGRGRNSQEASWVSVLTNKKVIKTERIARNLHQTPS